MHPSLISQMLLLAAEGPLVRDGSVSPARSSFETDISPSIAAAVTDVPPTILGNTSPIPTDVSYATAFALMYSYPLLAYIPLVDHILSLVNTTNTLYHETGLVDPAGRTIVRTNLDTLYSEAAIDLSHADLELTVPYVPDGRFYVFSFYDLYGNNFCNLGTITNSTPETYYIQLAHNTSIVKPGPTFQPQYQGTIDYPTTYGIMLIRFLLYNNESDVLNMQAIQRQISIFPLNRTEPIAPYMSAALLNINLTESAATFWPGSLNDTTATQLLNLTARLSPYAPPENTSDIPRVQEYLTAAGLVNGTYTPPSVVNFTDAGVHINSTLDAFLSSNSTFTDLGQCWKATAPAISGDYLSDYTARACVAWSTYLLLSSYEAIYPEYYGFDNPNGLLSVEACSALILTFSGESPVSGFWSLTAYGVDNYLIPNDIGIYALGDRSNLTFPDGRLVYGNNSKSDGEFKFLVQLADKAPPDKLKSNWLPAPAGGGNFFVNLRYCGPKKAITGGNYTQPVVTKSKAILHDPESCP